MSGGDGGETVMSGAGPPADAHPDEAYCSACNQSFSPSYDHCPNDGSKLVRFKAQRDPLINRVLDGRYRVQTPLGEGGMGTVYRAWQLSVDREVAVKVVHAKLASDRMAAKRFLREARLASRLSQPTIVNVYDFGQTEDGVLYLVMELLRGRTLAAELARHRPLGAKRTATIALQLCDALEAAHSQGIIHRDLKPGNIVILDDPPGRDLVKVLDFGLAKSLVGEATSQVTKTDAIIGTPLYMCPEQVQGKPSDQRGDLYSLGCILYEALAGTPPFVDSSINLVLGKHVSAPPPPLPANVPPGLRVLVERMLAKAPDDRVQTAGEARTAVQAVLEGGFAVTGPEPRVEAAPPLSTSDALAATAYSTGGSPARAAATPQPAIASVLRPAEPEAPRRKLPWVIGGLLALAGAVGIAVALTKAGGGSVRAAVDADSAGHGIGPSIDASMAGVPVVARDASPARDAAASPHDAPVAPPIDAPVAPRDGRRHGDHVVRDAGAAVVVPPRVIDAPPPPRVIDAPTAPAVIDGGIDFYHHKPRPAPKQ